MIIQEDFLKKLRAAFDLNIYEVKIWTALLSRGLATAGELSDVSSVPRSRSYDILESLEKKGFVLMKLGKPIKYLAVQPEDIIKRVKKDLTSKTSLQLENLEKIKEEKIFKDIELLYKQGIDHVDPSALSGALKGRDNSYSQMQSMLEKATKSVSIATSAKGLVRKLTSFKKTFKKLADKGIKVKIIAPVTKEAEKLLAEYKGLVQVKNLSKLNARFIIVDDKEIMFMVTDDSNIHESVDTGIWANTPYFANALNTMFNQNWGITK
ncbi:MAG: helix-turn-helix domain-containing protein [Candidatus Nanoarchaeia archaeon]|nr:helix-turn-helix domain-containing protein [Candidatus Nanoarchaeia archaeon]